MYAYMHANTYTQAIPEMSNIFFASQHNITQKTGFNDSANMKFGEWGVGGGASGAPMTTPHCIVPLS